MKVHIDTSGILSMLEDIGEGILDMKESTALKIADNIIDTSASLCPRATGTLAKATYVQSDGSKVTFGHGGPNDLLRPQVEYRDDLGNVIKTYDPEYVSEYAYIVHEDLTTPHKHGEAKFLEKAILKHQNEVTNALANDYADMMQNTGIKWRGRGKPKKRGGLGWTR